MHFIKIKWIFYCLPPHYACVIQLRLSYPVNTEGLVSFDNVTIVGFDDKWPSGAYWMTVIIPKQLIW